MMRIIYIFILLMCLTPTALGVTMGAGTEINITDVCIVLGNPIVYNTWSVETDSFTTNAIVFKIVPQSFINLELTTLQANEISFSTVSAAPNNAIDITLTNTGWSGYEVVYYINNVEQETLVPVNGLISVIYDGSTSSQSFQFIRVGTPPPVHTTNSTLQDLIDNTDAAVSLAGVMPIVIIAIAILSMLIGLYSGVKLSPEVAVIAILSIIMIVAILWVGLNILSPIADTLRI